MRGFDILKACAGQLRAIAVLVHDLLRTRIATRRMIHAMAVGFAATISPAVASAAAYGECVESGCVLFLEGRIGPDDVAIFKRLLEEVGGKKSLTLSLDSEGGDIAAAIEIGRLVRRWPEPGVLVTRDSKCFSACVFVLAGGLRRIVHGTVGIHRPFGSGTEAQSYDATQKKFRALEQAAKKYLHDMNVPASLYDEMMSVPPQKLRVLTKVELDRFGIGQDDPAYQELRDAEGARKYGLDKEEFFRRRARSGRICNTIGIDERKAGTQVTLMEYEQIKLACIDALLRQPFDPEVGTGKERGR